MQAYMKDTMVYILLQNVWKEAAVKTDFFGRLDSSRWSMLISFVGQNKEKLHTETFTTSHS